RVAALFRVGPRDGRDPPRRRRLHGLERLEARPKTIDVTEVAPGIHRIESELGPRFMCQYIFVGAERSLLVDTGVAGTPARVIVPYLEQLGTEPDLVLISHADLDHSGGNRAVRARYPRAVLACHELDRRWIESNEAMLRENYLWHEPYGFEEPDDAGRQAMLADMGGDCPI